MPSLTAIAFLLACSSPNERVVFSDPLGGAGSYGSSAGAPSIGAALPGGAAAAGSPSHGADGPSPSAGAVGTGSLPGSPDPGCVAPNVAPVAFGTKTEGSRVAAFLFAPKQQQLASFAAYGDAAREGVRLAVRELDTENFELITADGPGGDGVVRAFSSRGKPDEEFLLTPYPNFSGGIRLAACDVTGDGRVDVITAPGAGGGSLIKAFDRFDKDAEGNRTELANFVAYPESPDIEVFVACADLNADGTSEIATSLGVGAEPLVRLFSLEGATAKLLDAFVPYERAPIEGVGEDETDDEEVEQEPEPYTDGVSIALGDITGDGRAEIVIGNLLGTPEVRTFAFDGSRVSALKQLFPYGALKDHGIMLAVGQTDQTPELEIIVGPANADELPRTHIVDENGAKKLADVFPYNANLDGGVEVAAVPRGAVCPP